MHFYNRHTIVNSGNSKSFRRSYHNSTASYNLNIVRREAYTYAGPRRETGGQSRLRECVRESTGGRGARPASRRDRETTDRQGRRIRICRAGRRRGGIRYRGALYYKTITNYRIHSRSHICHRLTLYYINALSLCETTGGQGAGAFMRHPPDLRASLLAARHSLAAPPRRGASVSLSVA